MTVRTLHSDYAPVTDLARVLEPSPGMFHSDTPRDSIHSEIVSMQIPLFGLAEDGCLFYELASFQDRNGSWCFVMRNRPQVGSLLLLPALMRNQDHMSSVEVLRDEPEGKRRAVYTTSL